MLDLDLDTTLQINYPREEELFTKSLRFLIAGNKKQSYNLDDLLNKLVVYVEKGILTYSDLRPDKNLTYRYIVGTLPFTEGCKKSSQSESLSVTIDDYLFGIINRNKEKTRPIVVDLINQGIYKDLFKNATLFFEQDEVKYKMIKNELRVIDIIKDFFHIEFKDPNPSLPKNFCEELTLVLFFLKFGFIKGYEKCTVLGIENIPFYSKVPYFTALTYSNSEQICRGCEKLRNLMFHLLVDNLKDPSELDSVLAYVNELSITKSMLFSNSSSIKSLKTLLDMDWVPEFYKFAKENIDALINVYFLELGYPESWREDDFSFGWSLFEEDICEDIIHVRNILKKQTDYLDDQAFLFLSFFSYFNAKSAAHLTLDTLFARSLPTSLLSKIYPEWEFHKKEESNSFDSNEAIQNLQDALTDAYSEISFLKSQQKEVQKVKANENAIKIAKDLEKETKSLQVALERTKEKVTTLEDARRQEQEEFKKKIGQLQEQLQSTSAHRLLPQSFDATRFSNFAKAKPMLLLTYDVPATSFSAKYVREALLDALHQCFLATEEGRRRYDILGTILAYNDQTKNWPDFGIYFPSDLSFFENEVRDIVFDELSGLSEFSELLTLNGFQEEQKARQMKFKNTLSSATNNGEIRTALTDAGFIFLSESNHMKFRYYTHPVTLTSPCTPSNGRSLANLASYICRTYL